MFEPFPSYATILLLSGSYQALMGVLRLGGIAPVLPPAQEIVVGLLTVSSGLLWRCVLAWLRSV
jgi:MFS superfamily sulfate permease-like transporter